MGRDIAFQTWCNLIQDNMKLAIWTVGKVAKYKWGCLSWTNNIYIYSRICKAMISTFCRYWLIPTGKTENPQKNRWIVHLQDGWYQHPMGGRAMICPVGQLKMPRSFPLWRPNSWIFTSVYRLFCLSGNQTWQFYAMFDYRRVSMNVFFLNPLSSLLRRVGYQLVCAASDHGLLAEGAGIGQFASSESLIMK